MSAFCKLRAAAVFGLLACSFGACADSSAPAAPTALQPSAAVQAPAASSTPAAIPTPVPAQATDRPTAAPTLAQPLATAAPPPARPAAVPAIALPTALPPFPTRSIGADTLGELRLLRTAGFGGAQSAAIAPNGKLLAVGTTAGLALFDVPGLRPLRFDPVEGGVDQLALSPDGAMLALEHSDELTTTLRPVGDARGLADLAGGAPQFSPDGQVVATIGDAVTRQPTTRLWRARDGVRIAEIAGAVAAFSPNGGYLATRDSQYLDPLPAIQLRGSDGARLFELPGRFAAFSPDGARVAIAADTSVEIRQLPAGQLVATLQTGAAERVWGLAFSADGQQLFVQADAMIESWSVPDARRLRSLPSGLAQQPSGQASFTPGGAIVALPFSLGDGAGLRLVRVADGALVHDEEPWQVDVTFDAIGTTAALVNPDTFSNGRVRLVDLANRQTSDLDLHSYQNVVFSPDAQSLAISDGGQVELTRAVDGGLLRALPVENGPIAGGDARLLFSPDGKIVSLAGSLNIPYGGPLYGAAAWDAATGQPVGAQAPAAPPLIVLREASAFGASAYADGRMLALYPRDAAPITHTLPLTITALSFSQSGGELAAADASGMVQLFRTGDGAQIGTYQGGVALPGRLAFSPDGTLLGVLGAGGSAVVWRIDQAQPLARLAAAADDNRLIFTADNELAISAGPQGVTFFRLADGSQLRTLQVGVRDIAIGPRRRVLALLHDGQVQLWGVP